MTAGVPEDARMEIKFVGYRVNYDTVLNALRMHPLGFTVPYPDRQINNVYFDTFEYSALAENLSGVSSRTKVRYRWYGGSKCPSSGALEIKCKRNFFGWKLRYKAKNLIAQSTTSWQEIRQAMVQQMSAEAKQWLDNRPLPVFINRYTRNYLVSSNGKMRATIDTRQEVWDQRYASHPSFILKANLPDTLVVEFKFDRELQPMASKLLQGFPLRVSRHSKYVNAVLAIQN